jgi:thiamine kinase-like enzyme
VIEESCLRGYIQEVVTRNFSQTPESIVIESVTGGENHLLYKATCHWKEKGSSLVLLVRIKIDVSSAFQRAKSEREARVLTYLNGNLAPRIYSYDTSSRWFSQPVICLAYIEGKTPQLNTLPLEEMTILGKTLARLHTIKANSFDLDTDPRKDALIHPIDYLISRWEWDISRKIPKDDEGLPPASIMRRFWDLQDRVFQFILRHLNESWFNLELVPSLLHTDLGGANIVWTSQNEPYFIDWEYARMGDPAEEIAYIFTENQLLESHRQALWEGYIQQSKDDIAILKSRCLVWQPFTAFGGIWWLDRYIRSLKVKEGVLEDRSIPKPPDFYLERAISRMDYTESILQRLDRG